MPALDWLWSRSLGSPVRTLAFAREAELLLAAIDGPTLALLNARGDLQGQLDVAELTCSCLADDGSAVIAGTGAGRVRRFAPDLSPLHEHGVGAAVTAIACDPFGRHVAVGDRSGKLHLHDAAGRETAHFDTPRPLRHLAFVPEQPWLVAAADFGWAGCLDLMRREWLWTDRPVSNIGSLAIAGSGNPVVLACFSEGLRHYDAGAKSRWTAALPATCERIALDDAGKRGIAAGGAPIVYAFGDEPDSWPVELPITALAIAPLGDRVFLGHADGKVQCARIVD